MSRRRQRALWAFSAASLAAGIAAGATAAPGGDPKPLAATSQFAADGGAQAPTGSGDGAAEAPPASPPPTPEPVEPPPAANPPATEPIEPVETSPHVPVAEPDPDPAPTAVEQAPVDPSPAEPEGPAPEPEPTPTTDQALEAENVELVPVEALGISVTTARQTAPLIDISPDRVPTPKLQPVGEAAQGGEDDGEVIIPVPIDELDGEEDGGTDGGGTGDGAEPQSPATGVPDFTSGGLALTGLPLAGLFMVGVFLMLGGVVLRMALVSAPAPVRA